MSLRAADGRVPPKALYRDPAANQSPGNSEMASGKKQERPRNDICLLRVKQSSFILFLLILTSCNAPIQPQTAESASTLTIPTSILTFAPTIAPTFTSIPLSPTSTPIPCDPLTSDYCISNWNFLFQPPVLPPDNDSVDGTYRYGSTQNGARDPHHGVEFQNRFGTPVFAAGDGEVVFADSDKETKFSPWTNFYGNTVLIRHAGDLYTLYAHLSNIFVLAGSQVKAGERIGEVGQSGGATGSHLHFEVRQGSDVYDYFSTQNPELWLIPKDGTGALSITLNTPYDRNYEYPLVITRLADGFVTYGVSYTKGFEHNPEDAVLNNLPQGEYKIAFNDRTGLNERIVIVKAGRLTQVIFEVK